YGRVGRSIARVLEREGVPFVVVDRDPDAIERAARDGVLALAGDGSDDEVLRRAGIDQARGLITAVAADADNILVTLSPRARRPDLTIVARANYDDTAA